jgi:hypothetical protein
MGDLITVGADGSFWISGLGCPADISQSTAYTVVLQPQYLDPQTLFYVNYGDTRWGTFTCAAPSSTDGPDFKITDVQIYVEKYGMTFLQVTIQDPGHPLAGDYVWAKGGVAGKVSADGYASSYHPQDGTFWLYVGDTRPGDRIPVSLWAASFDGRVGPTRIDWLVAT